MVTTQLFFNSSIWTVNNLTGYKLSTPSDGEEAMADLPECEPYSYLDTYPIVIELFLYKVAANGSQTPIGSRTLFQYYYAGDHYEEHSVFSGSIYVTGGAVDSSTALRANLVVSVRSGETFFAYSSQHWISAQLGANLLNGGYWDYCIDAEFDVHNDKYDPDESYVTLGVWANSYINAQCTLTVQRVLTVNVAGEGNVAKNPDQPSYYDGQSVQLTAQPAEDYQFTGWRDDLDGIDNPANIIMNADKTVTSTFQVATTKRLYLNEPTWTINTLTKNKWSTPQEGTSFCSPSQERHTTDQGSFRNPFYIILNVESVATDGTRTQLGVTNVPYAINVEPRFQERVFDGTIDIPATPVESADALLLSITLLEYNFTNVSVGCISTQLDASHVGGSWSYHLVALPYIPSSGTYWLLLFADSYIDVQYVNRQFDYLKFRHNDATHALCLVHEGKGNSTLGTIPHVTFGGITYDIYLVPTDHPFASPVRIHNNTGTHAIRYYTTYLNGVEAVPTI